MTTPTDARIALIDIASVAISSTPDGGMDELRKQMGVLKDFLNEQEALMALVADVLAADQASKGESCETRHLDALFESVGKLAAHFKED